MEAEIKKLKLREAEDAKTLETMVQHVEANLKRTTVSTRKNYTGPKGDSLPTAIMELLPWNSEK